MSNSLKLAKLITDKYETLNMNEEWTKNKTAEWVKIIERIYGEEDRTTREKNCGQTEADRTS
jgi:hypothetical protein